MECLVLLRVLESKNYSEWGAPYFAQPKPKKIQVSFINDFRNLNNQLKHKPFTFSNINEMLSKLEGLSMLRSLI